ncbi:MAG: DUF2807 domain-containing protein [Saprospiraceae bacterium]|nr:DUF2807 domain-containing protein [Saprospiraceae bacterium]
MNNLIPGALTCVLLFSFGCKMQNSTDSEVILGDGNIISQEVALTQFQDIELQNSCNVEIMSGPEYKASISDHSNLIQYIKFEVSGSKLIIRNEPETINLRNSKAKVIIFIPSTDLNSLSISGSGNITLKTRINNISKIHISGSGNVTSEVASTTKNLVLSISGSGNIDLLSIQTQKANCNISGSGNINMATSDSLNIAISGSGNVFYKGEPTIVKTISGSGESVKL